MNNLKSHVVAAVLFLTMGTTLNAQTERAQFSIEIDPITYAFNGFSIHARMTPKGSDHLFFGVGAYAMDMPDVLVNTNKFNRDEGWNSRLNQGYSFFFEYHFSEVNRKLFIGAQTGVQEYKVSNDNFEGSTKFTNYIAMAYLGYTIKPFKNNLYFKPWAGLGYTSQIAGNNTLGAENYEIAPLIPFVTFHIGYTF
ncbi:MAG: hypothetical protein HRT58_12820 [Crocinitomicaceae bacterium]|nr:hypothetical protein [Flavobacteriales bacterium]NQZ36547.1 hypothetical protein [Crocinitomicaceae bacterium]